MLSCFASLSATILFIEHLRDAQSDLRKSASEAAVSFMERSENEETLAPSVSRLVQNSATAAAVPVIEHINKEETLLLPIGRVVEPSLPSHSWFSGDPSCAHLLTRFARPGSLPDARLASFPRSGNTWTRYLLEAATGLVTCGPTSDSESAEVPPAGALPAAADVLASVKRSFSTSEELNAAGFIGEHVSPLTRTCIVGKTHIVPPAWMRLEGDESESDMEQSSSDGGDSRDGYTYPLPAVLLVRDPFRAIISLRHLLTKGKVLLKESIANATAFSGPVWRRFVEVESFYWFVMADEWAESPQQTLLVPYERLVANTESELRRMLSFLGVTPTPERLRCTLRHLEGAFINKQHPVVPNEETFDAATRRLIWCKIRRLDDMLASRGYQRLPVESYAFYNESKTMSECETQTVYRLM